MTVRYHLNADVGEGFDTDAELLELVTQANVACGFHAGDDATMRAVCALAVQHGVQVGAQPSYRDRENFGRVDVEIGYDDLVRDLTDQVQALQAAAGAAGTAVGYLKPHGALYNRVVHDADQAKAVVDVALAFDLPLMTLPGSVAHRLMADSGGTVIREFFGDRAYDGEGRLVKRSVEGSVISDAGVVTARIEQLLSTETVTAIDGATVDVEADSVCVHGDTPNAVTLARAAREALGLALR
jgi:UPF0271 protein